MSRFSRRLALSLALLLSACGGAAVVYIGQNPAFPNALLVVVKQGGSRQQPKAVAWTKDPDGNTVDVKELVVAGEAEAATSKPKALSGAIEIADLPPGTYTLRARHSDGKAENCPGTLQWFRAHGELSGSMYFPPSGPCPEEDEEIKAGEKLLVDFVGSGGEGIVLLIAKK